MGGLTYTEVYNRRWEVGGIQRSLAYDVGLTRGFKCYRFVEPTARELRAEATVNAVPDATVGNDLIYIAQCGHNGRPNHPRCRVSHRAQELTAHCDEGLSIDEHSVVRRRATGITVGVPPSPVTTVCADEVFNANLVADKVDRDIVGNVVHLDEEYPSADRGVASGGNPTLPVF